MVAPPRAMLVPSPSGVAIAAPVAVQRWWATVVRQWAPGVLPLAGGKEVGGANATGGATSTSTTASPSTGGVKATGGASSAGVTSTGGTNAVGGSSATGGSGTGGSTTTTSVSVLQHHNHASRDGIYVDAAITKATAATLHIDTTFASATLSGPTYAQPLYLAANGSGPDLVIAATEQDRVYAFNAATGAQIYNVLLATPIPLSVLPCGNINPLGVTGTPIIDASTRTIYLDAMTSVGGTSASARHQVYALNADTGAILNGWPVDLNATVTSGATTFNSLVQNQRGALALLGGKVFVPFGGHLGDCEAITVGSWGSQPQILPKLAPGPRVQSLAGYGHLVASPLTVRHFSLLQAIQKPMLIVSLRPGPGKMVRPYLDCRPA